MNPPAIYKLHRIFVQIYDNLMSTIEFNPLWKEKLLNRFLSYVKIYSTSDAESEATPSTERQWDIANYITEELKP